MDGQPENEVHEGDREHDPGRLLLIIQVSI